MREKILEAFEVKNFTQSSGSSEILRCSCGLEIDSLSRNFFSKVFKKFYMDLSH
eukprot:UN22846